MTQPGIAEMLPARPRVPMAFAAGFPWRLRDGTPVLLRPIRPDDAERELEFLHGLSPRLRGLRFLGLVKDPAADVARELTDLDPAHSAGYVATVFDEGRERQIGAAHFHVDPCGETCDCTVTVSDRWQRRGVGAALMRLLIDTARARGVRHMRALAPEQPDGSHHLAARLGFQRRPDASDPAVVVYHLELR